MKLVPLFLLLTVGCTARSVYRPFDGDVGYSSVQMDESHIRVDFAGGADLLAADCIELARVRAAEIALERQKPHLRIQSIEEDDRLKSQYFPGATYVTTHYVHTRHGRQPVEVWTEDPGHTELYDTVVVTAIFELLDEPAEASYPVVDVLTQAHAKGIRLSDATLSSLGLPPHKE